MIFITENDVIGRGKPLYRIERRIEDIDELFDDGEHIIYVNGANKDSATELGKLTVEEIASSIGLSIEKVAELAKPKAL